MKILQVNKKNLIIAVNALHQAGVVVFPTETVYGMAGDPFNAEVIDKIYKIKGRGFNKPLSLIADSFKTVEKYFKLNLVERRMAKKFWPGALTIILKLKKQTNNALGKLNRVGSDIAVRVSSSGLAQQLATNSRGLIISTSANISGLPECSDPGAVIKQFKNRKYQPNLILDAGRLKKQKPSTIILVKGDKINIVRQGEVYIK
ncbi:MAG: L-threonylcarbamoyladenylate synthase [Patescibacteria group bacterium]